ncbi:hypothetical protein [Oceanobacillus sp. CF4.6]|uniref:hypothetical protein n=1 Tax=Oceanobacillus sp. CF4.6 TaxID=3373080 RepID=UPI003EE7662E
MIQEELVNFKSSLFYKSERDLFDYYLNNVKFQNGPQLRNKHTHGRLGWNNKHINFNNYLVIMKLMVAIIIKINEYFCWYEIVIGKDHL